MVKVDAAHTTSYTAGYILTCTECRNQYRVDAQFRVEAVNRLLSSLPRYCPYCGTETVERGIDSDLDYWYELASACGLERSLEGVEVVRELYDNWPHDEYSRFMDFVKSLDED